MTRGIKHEVDRMVTQLQGKTLPMTFHGTPGTVELAMRPIQMWDVVFPKEHLQTMMRSFFVDPIMNPKGSIYWNDRHGKYLAALRYSMGLKKFPELDPQGATVPFYKQNVEIMGIGIKDDNIEQL